MAKLHALVKPAIEHMPAQNDAAAKSRAERQQDREKEESGFAIFLIKNCKLFVPFSSTPFFLVAQRRVVSSRQEEIAFAALTAQETKGLRPF